MGGGVGNCAFVLISGYVLIDKHFNLKRIIKLWIEVLTYSIFLGIIAYITKITLFSYSSLISMFFPVIFNQYWYMSTYVVLILLTPFLNQLFLNISRNKFKAFIIIGLIVFSAIPTFTTRIWMTNNIITFVVVYSIGAYMRMYDVRLYPRYNLLIALLMFVFMSGTIVAIKYINTSLHLNLNLFYWVWTMEKLPVILFAVFIFAWFKVLTVHLTSIVSFFSTSVFGVYLLHIGRLREYLFKFLFNDKEVYKTPYFLLWLIAVIICIFLICTLVDKIRIQIIERPIMKMLDYKLNRFNEYLKTYDILT